MLEAAKRSDFSQIRTNKFNKKAEHTQVCEQF